MKSLSKGSMSSAIRTIRANRARSLMTVTGIVIGVLAAIVVTAIGLGVEHQVNGQINQLGKDVVTVRPGSGQSSDVFSGLSTAPPTQQLTERDVQAAKEVHGVRSVTPLALIDGRVVVDQGNARFHGAVIGTSADFADVLHQGLDFGAFYSADDVNAQMAVIGSNVAAELFEENVPLGRSFNFRGQDFVVVGLLKPFDTAPLIGQADFNNAIFIPYDTAQTLTGGSSPVYEMLVRPNGPVDVPRVTHGLNSALLRVHGGQSTFSVLTQKQSLRITNGILNLMGRLVLAAASISLLVGGIGIMNIMWVSVAERMREIGIRKAIGATSRQILGQFLAESIVLSVSGWFIGAVLSLGAIGLLRLFSTLQPVIPWLMLAISFVVTMLVGVVFGSVPALKAAVKDPIEALRNE